MTVSGQIRCPGLFPVTFIVLLTSALYGNTLELIRKIPHSGYSEGLEYEKGFLWNALPKEIRKINPSDGSVVQTISPATEYSEGITWLDGVLWNVSFSNNGIYSGKIEGSRSQFQRRGSVPEVHAWGLAHDGKTLIFTGDYSSKLYFMDPKTQKVTKTLVTNERDLEDLAWDGKWIWSSSFTQNPGKIFRIHPKTGKVNGYFSLPNPQECPIIDGIAFDGKGLWVTGKECVSIYYFKLPK